MPDITMCASDCPRSQHCKRHTDSGTIPTLGRQSWFGPTPDINGCDRFWPVLGTTQSSDGEGA